MNETIAVRFRQTATRQRDRVAVRYKKSAHWIDVDWTLYQRLVDQTAAGLMGLGIRSGDRVAILSQTRFEWAIVDLAVLSLGATLVPIYPTNTVQDVEFILNHSESTLLVAESDGIWRMLADRRSSLGHLKTIVLIEPGSEMSLAELQAIGEEELKKSPQKIECTAESVQMHQIATLVYTSGTTGQPKGAVLTHAHVMSEVSEAFPLLGVNSTDVSLAFLPFAHVLGRIEIWGHALMGYTMCYAESIERLRGNLRDVRPTILMAVPRIFEKIYTSVRTGIEVSPIGKRIFPRALDLGRRVALLKAEQKPVPLHLTAQLLAYQRLVFDPILNELGGRMRFAVCGGAPLNQEISEFFASIGLLILEGYGLTETTGAVCVNSPTVYRFGTVGKPIGDVKIQLGEDGEILISSRKVMKEYEKDPVATQGALRDGWFATGDIGEISADGFLRITDRKKDLIKTAGGKYVAPQKLEGLLKASPVISQVHIHGDQKKYVVALIAVNRSAVSELLKSEEKLSDSLRVREVVKGVIADVNLKLASYESIKGFAVLERELTIEDGELTPSLKIRRRVVDDRYKDLLERLYR
jgi:long-chain acyl-CoA synthetase